MSSRAEFIVGSIAIVAVHFESFSSELCLKERYKKNKDDSVIYVTGSHRNNKANEQVWDSAALTRHCERV